MSAAKANILQRHPEKDLDLMQKIGSGTYGEVYKVNVTKYTWMNQICLALEQGGHSSWKSWKCPEILFCPGNVLGDDPFSAKGPGKVLELSN